MPEPIHNSELQSGGSVNELLFGTVDQDQVDRQISHLSSQMFEVYGLRILLALRRITHAVDSYSRKLATGHHITGPQLLCLYSLVKEGPMILTKLSNRLSLSPSTALGIIDRLENKGFIRRDRHSDDRRKITISATEKGRELAAHAPLFLQDKLAQALQDLPELEVAAMALSLEKMVDLLENHRLEPDPGSVTREKPPPPAQNSA